MKKSFKRFISTLLSFVMMLTLCVPAIATDTMESDIEAEIEAKIQARKAEIFNEVYQQLEAQNALSHMSAYEKILAPEIEMSVLAEYGISTYDAKYTAPYGGLVAYTIDGVDFGITYLDQMNSYYYILDTNSFHASDIIASILGYIPVIGGVFSAIFSLASIVNARALSSIKSCQGYAKIINTHDRYNGTDSSVVTGWTGHPIMIIPTGSTNVYATVFQENNPFE